jgi:cyclic 2,3-diphosphoglycerate synthetase
VALKVVALIDGEHHPAVARDALARAAEQHEIRGVLFVGGEEKVAHGVLEDPRRHYGFDVVRAGADPPAALRRLADGLGADAVLDLSGDPVLDGAGRFEVASAALDLGLEYRAAGLLLAPPPLERLERDVPIVSVIGTGKRSGKTAVAGHCARLLRERGLDPVIVAMGRGGPREPTLVRPGEADLTRLLGIVESGGHGASDYLEDAALSAVTTVGCRRCGEGPAGEVFDSNVVAGARLALSVSPDAIVLEGSGAALPPVEADRTVCVVAALRARADALSYLGPYRLLRSQLVLVAGADALEPAERDELKLALARWCGESAIIACAFEPEPAGEVPAGARVALFTTAPPSAEAQIRAQLAERGVEVEVFSPHLASREALERDMELAARKGCDLFLTELKAAAVEKVALRAKREGAGVVFLRNRPVSLEGEPSLDTELLAQFEHADVGAPSR